MLAALVAIWQDVAIDFSEEFHKILALMCINHLYVTIDRGAFPISILKEKNNPFINRLFAIDPEFRRRNEKLWQT